MPGKVPTHRYSKEQEGEFKVRALDALANSPVALSLDAIKERDMILRPLTSQKLSRVLGSLVELGFVQKSKSKQTGRMMYIATSVMEEQGYGIS